MNNNILSRLKWLEGKWKGVIGSGVYHEEWTSGDDDQLTGAAYMMKDDITGEREKLTLHYIDSKLAYTADVKHNPEPVSFFLTYSDNNKFVFENPEHDFPQKITYERLDDNSLTATIEATIEGKTKSTCFNLKRVD